MNKKWAFLFVGIVCLIACGFALDGDIPEPTVANLNNDDSADFIDFALMSENWQQTGTGLAGDLDDSNAVDIDDLMIFGWYWLTQYSPYQQCQVVDLDIDGIIAFEDMAKLAQNWLLSGQGLTGDFDNSNLVDCNDLSVFADCWLKGSRPETAWEQFKAALWNDDLDKALTFIADFEAEEYTTILTDIRPQFQDMVAGMGNMVLISIDAYRAKYEMLHDEGGGVMASYSVYFCKDKDGNWKIYCF